MSGAPTEDEMLDGFHSTTADVVATNTPASNLAAPDEKKHLCSMVDRIVRLLEEKDELAADVRDIYQEAKSAGYNVKAIRIAVSREREDAEQAAARKAVEDEAELIITALGEFASSPLGAAAVSRGKH